MIDVKKDGRHVVAMVMNEPVNGVFGVVQCMIAGCEAYMPLMDERYDEDGTRSPADQVRDFMEHHDCDPTRFRGRHGKDIP